MSAMKRLFPRLILLPALALAVSTLTGCSSRAWYEGLRAQQRQNCMGLPADQYEACMDQANTSYDSYQRQRAEARQPQ